MHSEDAKITDLVGETLTNKRKNQKWEGDDRSGE